LLRSGNALATEEFNKEIIRFAIARKVKRRNYNLITNILSFLRYARGQSLNEAIAK